MPQGYNVVRDFKQLHISQSTLQLNAAGSAITMGTSHSGDIVTLNATAGSAVTLPVPKSGLFYQFIVTNTGPHTLTAPSACINGALGFAVSSSTASLATGAAKTSISTTAGSVVGDSFNLVSDGSKYYLRGNVTNFNAVKFA